MDQQIVTILGGLNWDSLLNWEGFNFRFVACSAKFVLMDVLAFVHQGAAEQGLRKTSQDCETALTSHF